MSTEAICALIESATETAKKHGATQAEAIANQAASELEAMVVAMVRASAQLRHAYWALQDGRHIDPGLISSAIQILERATSKRSA